MTLKPTFSVFCGAKLGNSDDYTKMANDIAEMFYRNNWTLVYGGSIHGIMGVMAQKLDCLGGKVIGVYPRPFLHNEPHNRPPQFMHGCMVLVEDITDQKKEMLRRSDAFLVLPGGFGTLEEIVTIRLWKRLKIHNRPIIIYDFQGYFNSLLSWMNDSIVCGLASQAAVDDAYQVVRTQEELISTLEMLATSLSEAGLASADRSIGDMSSIALPNPGKIHPDWKNPRPFQEDPDNPGVTFIREFTKKKLDDTLVSLALLCRLDIEDGPMSIRTANVDGAKIGIGKRNIIVPIKFNDGVIWIARIRIPNNKNINPSFPCFKESETASMQSEIATMRLIQGRTTIPVPRIYGFNAEWENELGVPYMLLENINGKPFPFPFSTYGFITDAQIDKIHSQLVGFQHQLGQLEFPGIGQVYHDTDETSFRLGPIIDRKGRQFGPFSDSSEFYIARARAIVHEATDGGNEEDQRTAFLHLLSAQNMRESHGPFTLKHQDLHLQNVLLDEECNIRGIIDWTWCSTVPPESQYPLPFNIAHSITPEDKNLIEHHDSRGWDFLKEYTPTPASKSLLAMRGSRTASVARLLDNYSWPLKRKAEFAQLKLVSQTSSTLTF